MIHSKARCADQQMINRAAKQQRTAFKQAWQLLENASCRIRSPSMEEHWRPRQKEIHHSLPGD